MSIELYVVTVTEQISVALPMNYDTYARFEEQETVWISSVSQRTTSRLAAIGVSLATATALYRQLDTERV